MECKCDDCKINFIVEYKGTPDLKINCPMCNSIKVIILKIDNE